MQGDPVQRAKRGDHEAFDALARAAYDRLFSVSYRILREADRADDAVQECLVRAWRDVRGRRDPERWEAWLYRPLVNACRDEARRRRSRSREITLLAFDPRRTGRGAPRPRGPGQA